MDATERSARAARLREPGLIGWERLAYRLGNGIALAIIILACLACLAAAAAIVWAVYTALAWMAAQVF